MSEPVPGFEELPRFANPPVVELAIGVEFLPLPSLSVVPLVELRPLWSQEYPRIEEQPALPSMNLGKSPIPGFNFEVGTGVPPIRIWLLNENRSELLQVQYDRLVLNWRANYGSDYPHYRELEPRFMRNWALLQSAVAERSLGELQPITAEVTYINRFTLEDGETLFDVLSVLRSNSHFEKSEPTIQLTTAIVTADESGQYGEQNISAARSRDEKREVQLMSVTRVSFFLGESDPITKALRRAHASAVTNFAQVTTGKMHQRWGRIQ
jgi:uncharacterized protein (TIGR04255 family)